MKKIKKKTSIWEYLTYTMNTPTTAWTAGNSSDVFFQRNGD